MASPYTQINLAELAPPDVVEVLDYEVILAAMLADLQARDTSFSALVESDPAYKILEVCAYRELLIRQRVNEASRAVMIAYAASADLDQIGANYGVARLLITPADNATIPPTPAIYEQDSDFRTRIILSLEGYTTAGSRASYIYHALSADGDVRDADATSSSPGVVDVAVLSRTGDGAASSGLIATVVAALNSETVRPLCDSVSVTSATITEYDITAALTLYPGVGQAEVLASSIAAANQYATDQHRLGRDITLSGVYAALHQPGVQNVNLTSPATSIVVAWDEAAYCTGITITVSGTGE